LLFFKAFILPCFDYCVTLSIYFSRNLIEKLGKVYYRTLYNLLKFDFNNNQIAEINRKLEVHDLQAFQYRIIWRLLTFINKIATGTRVPIGLKEELERTTLRNENYMLRSNNNVILQPLKVRSKFGDLIFKNVCSRIVKKIKCLDFYGDVRTFKSELNLFDSEVIENFLKVVPNFDIDLSRIKFYR
jgi:hypothetical protein